MREVARTALLLAVVSLGPSLVYAQELAGTVRDSSGAVLPGTTVEASSPALIEKVRTTVTDGSGQYRIPNLRPGTYVVTFSLAGFTTVRRDAVEVSGAQVITINADMRVSAVEETITVTGETPVVDVQTSTRKQTVLDDSVISVLPASRGYGNLLATVPGISGTGLDVSSNVSTNFFTARGGRGNEGTIQIDGMNVGSAFNGGGVAGFGYDTANAAEIQVTIAGGLGETDRGGPQFNMIPKTGGNSFSGTFFLSTAGEWSQGSNLDDELRAFAITEGAALIKNWDTNFALGGPILRDRLWFFGNLRSYGQHTDIPGLYGNLNAGDPNAWFYAPDPNLKARAATDKRIGAIRLTSQVTPRNKVGFYYDYQKNCTGSSLDPDGDQCRQPGDGWVALGSIGGFGSMAPEAHNVWDDREKIVQGSWSSTATNRLLLEAGVSSFNSRWGGQEPSGALTGLIPVTETTACATVSATCPQVGAPVANFTYRGWASSPSNDQQHNVWRASLAYITGAHNMKFGYQAAYQVQKQFQYAGSQVSYTFNNRVPSSFTLRIAPHAFSNRTRYDAFYAQDQWTMNRLTVQAGLRYEHAWSWYPEGENGIVADNAFGSQFFFPETEGVRGYHDITPRVGAAYDVFGTGRTSVKANVSKYLQPANNEGTFTIRNPGGTLQTTTTRSWTDANGNFAIDCGPLAVNAAVDNRAAGGDFCGPYTNANFGNALQTTRVNPEVLEGWGIRPYDWQFSVAVQQEVLPRVSVEVGYNRRSWGNFFVTDNAAIGPSDFNRVTVTAPQHPELPDGGGYPVAFMVRNANSPLGATDNYFTFASDYGDVTYYWQGVDVTVNARMANGLTFQGGTSSGAGRRDNCGVTAEVPELLAVSFPFTTQPENACDVDEPWLTSVRGLVSYTIPRVEVFLSASMRSVPNVQPDAGGTLVASNGTSLAANRNFSGAEVPGGLAPGVPFQGVNLLLPGEQYGERVNAVDLRFGKILRFAGTRTNIALDLYNLFNANTGTAYNQSFDALSNGSTWLRPTAILNPRFVRFNVTFDF